MLTPDAGAALANDIAPARLQEIYSRTAAFYDEVVAEHQARAKETGLRLLGRQSGERFLEVGAGTGWAFERLLAQSGGRNAIAADPADGMIDVARRRIAGRESTLLQADGRALPFRGAAFDCLFCSYTLEVLPQGDIERLLAEMRRVLRPAGRCLVIDLTEGEGPDAVFTDEWKQGYLKDPEYYGGARPLRLSPMLHAAGFELVERLYSSGEGGWPSEVVLARRS